MLQTEYEFVLPRGYVDEAGNVHRSGIMRLATTLDEIEPLSDPRAKSNELYLAVLLLSRVVIRLGSLQVTPTVIENLFSSDFSFLQELYMGINQPVSFAENLAGETVETQCPNCNHVFALDLAPNPNEQLIETQ